MIKKKGQKAFGIIGLVLVLGSIVLFMGIYFSGSITGRVIDSPDKQSGVEIEVELEEGYSNYRFSRQVNINEIGNVDEDFCKNKVSSDFEYPDKCSFQITPSGEGVMKVNCVCEHGE